MSAVTTAPYVPVALGLPTRPLRWIRSTIIFAGPLLAPFFFSWSAVIVLAILHFPMGYLYLIGHHRLFSHRSFHAKGPLRYDAQAQELISDRAGLAYPIRDGIPIMLVDEARQLNERG